MARVIMTCGKLCSGKSTYANRLRIQQHAVVLSVDEITLSLFGQDAGDKHDDYVERAEHYLYTKSLDIIEIGVNVILDWGFWTKRERDYAREFYSARNIDCEFHYIDISEEEWNRRLAKRNQEVLDQKTDAYYVDAGLAAKFESWFECPQAEEIDVWVKA